MKGKKKTLFVLALLLLVGISSGYVATTYAKYVSTVNSSGKATIAKWNFTQDNKGKEYTIVLNENVHETTLVDGKIAPGTSGSFDVVVSNSSETGVRYTIKLTDIPTTPANLKFYKDAAKTPLTADDSITGVLKAKKDTDEETPTATKKIYWAWEYENGEDGNLDDTKAGYAAAGLDENGVPVTPAEGVDPAKLTIGVQITGVQIEPSSEPIASETN